MSEISAPTSPFAALSSSAPPHAASPAHEPSPATTRAWVAEYQIAVAESERRERQVAALYELWRSIPDTDPSRILQRIVERAASAMDGHTCSLLLRERDGDVLRVAASVGLAQDVADSVMVLVGERIAGRVAASGQPILVQKDPSTHPLLAPNANKAHDIAPRPEVESALCAPLVGPDGAVVGVLCLSRFAPATPFAESDLRVFSLFAAQAGNIISHTRTVEDLTRAGQEAAQMEREMARNAHLAALGQFGATVAHELRNPLSSIKGAAQFLLRECGEAAGLGEQKAQMLRDFLTIVVDEADGLGRLTTDLLEFARPTPPQRETHDLTDISRAEVSFLRPELDALGVARVREIYPDGITPTVLADRAQIGQSLRNLLLNAAQAGAAAFGGGDNETGTTITVRLEAENDFYRLSVEDNGPGVAPDLREKLWEPFFTTKARGSGLGLAQVRRVVVAHGGTTSVDDAPREGDCENGGSGRRGARFSLCLPAAVTASCARAAVTATVTAAVTAGSARAIQAKTVRKHKS